MPLFKRKHEPPPEPAPPISDEAEVHRAIYAGAERRRAGGAEFSVLCVIPQLIGTATLLPAETEAATASIAAELRGEDRFCLLADGSYIVVLAETEGDHGLVVAQRLGTDLTVRSAGIKQRKWLVGIARDPLDVKTEAALIELARADAAERDAA